MAQGHLVPWPGIESMPPALEVQSFHPWTAREVPEYAPQKISGGSPACLSEALCS